MRPGSQLPRADGHLKPARLNEPERPFERVQRSLKQDLPLRQVPARPALRAEHELVVQAITIKNVSMGELDMLYRVFAKMRKSLEAEQETTRVR